MNDFEFSQISFDSDLVQIISLSSNLSRKIDLPLTQGPIHFSVARHDGKLSNRWGVKVNRKGDAYIYRRDKPHAGKVSLHASGQQHISIPGDIAKSVGTTSRFGNKWSEPVFGNEAVATFTLVFPPWGVGFDLTNIPEQIKKHELLIIGDIEKMVVVAFFIVDSNRSMQGRVPHIVLGRIPIKQDKDPLPSKIKTLYIVAWKEPQSDLMDRIMNVLPQAAKGLLSRGHGAGEYVLTVQGYRQPNSAYMVSAPVSVCYRE